MNIFKYLFLKSSWLLVLVLVLHSGTTFAQSRGKNPLNINVQDELLPVNNRDLSESEKSQLQESLQRLNEDAKTQLDLGNEAQAFEIFYRQIRLTRALGVVEELEIITEVGKIAWEKNRIEDLRFLTERLTVLEAKNTRNNRLNADLLPLFLDGYQTLGDINRSISIQQQMLVNAREKNDQQQVKKILENLGNAYLSIFNYFGAKPIYEELLTLSETDKSYVDQTNYLQKLSQINGNLLRVENAVEYKKRLVVSHTENERFTAIPMVKIAIANDYKMMDNPSEAGYYYQKAFNLAWSLGQYAIAGDALKGLGKLYQDYQELNSALQVYRELIKIEEQSYNFYGLMETYEQMGVIYQSQNRTQEARESFTKALQIAQQLRYRESDFVRKIEQL